MMDKAKLLMLLKKKSMGKPSMMMMGPSMDDDYEDESEMEDEPGGYEREGMRIAAQDLIDAIRDKDSLSVMDALERFMSMCK